MGTSYDLPVPEFPQLRTLDEIRETILSMPFARVMQLDIEFAEGGVGIVSMPLTEAVTFDGSAFAGMAIGIVGDVAAGVATLAMTPPDEMALTGTVESSITGSTKGTRLSARAELRERSDTALIYDATVEVRGSGGELRQCGTAVVTMRVARPKSV